MKDIIKLWQKENKMKRRNKKPKKIKEQQNKKLKSLRRFQNLMSLQWIKKTNDQIINSMMNQD